jgi:hypothetical protein
MGTDYLDWGGVYPSQTTHPLFDMGELAARLGALVTYDRRGGVIWQNGFDLGLDSFGTNTVKTGSEVVLVATPHETPPFACNLHLGAVSGATAGINRRLEVPASLNIGAAISFRPSTDHDRLQLDIHYNDGTYKTSAFARFDPDAGTIAIYKQGPAWQTVKSSIPDVIGPSAFVHFKIVVDLHNNQWLRLLFGNDEVDISDYAPHRAVDATSPRIEFNLFNYSEKVLVNDCWVDNVIITASEPPNG